MLYKKAVELFINNLKVLERSPETISSYTKDLGYIKDFLEEKYNGCIYVEDVNQQDLEAFLLYQKERGLKSASRSRNLYTMRSFFKYLFNSGLIGRNPAAMIGNIKVKNKEREVLTKDEVYRIYEAIDHKIVRVVVIFLYFSGMRISEALKLELPQIDIGKSNSKNTVQIISGKGNKDRIVPLNDEIREILIDYLENIRPDVETDYLFANKKTGEISAQYVNREIKKALMKTKIDKDISCHSLRHSYATSLINADVNIVHVSKLLGHSSVKTTSIYTHSNIEDLKSCVEML